MLKKLLKLGTTFFILLGCYLGYVRAFDLVIRQFQSDRLDRNMIFEVRSPRSRQQAKELARRAFGPDHWTVTDDLPYAYYNSQRGFWMYWQKYEEIQEEDGVRYGGKRVRMSPFVMIGKAGDGKSLWTLTCEVATLDLNQPIGLSNKQNSGGIKVEHAHLSREVWIRDDRGTPEVPDDDMKIGPMTYVDYDEAKRQITTESHVHIEDPDQTTDGDGLEILLRTPDPNLATSSQSSSSSGFGGAEYAILQKNVRVVLRDVGNSGVFSGGSAQPAKSSKGPGSPKTVALTVGSSASDPARKEEKSAAKPEPVPLYVQSDSLMRVDFPPDVPPVVVGPPAPPLPTLVRFERKVVALHGHLDRQPNQLDCDTLRLTLVPPEPAGDKAGAAGKKADRNAPGTTAVDPATSPTQPTPVAAAGPATQGDSQAGPEAGSGPSPASGDGDAAGGKKGSVFGNLTLQKAHATGHVVWLQLRQQAAKVRCIEMIHERGLPYRPDSTFFRGDKTRKVWLEKIDYEPEEGDGPGEVAAATPPATDRPQSRVRKIKSVTHVDTIAAKLFDKGNGLELVDVRAFGPGRLETRPSPGQPVERIAVWQDELTIVNLTHPDGTLQQKRVTLTGTRPFFVDLPKKASLDSGQEIRVFLKPRSAPTVAAAPVAAAAPSGSGPAPAVHLAAKPLATGPAGDAFATGGESPAPKGASAAGADASTGLGASLQIERLLAYRDVHFKAPNRYMEARSWLDAPFIEVDPVPTPEASTPGARADVAPAGAGTTAPSEGPPPSQEPKAAEVAKDTPPESQAEPAMTAVADRIWALVAIPRGQSLDPAKDRRKKTRSQAIETRPETVATGGASTNADSQGGEADVREALLRGNVAVHQDKAPDPRKKDEAMSRGSDICGEKVYLDNKGKGKVNARVFHRDKDDPTPLPGPIRWAKVSTDDMLVYGETLVMDQEHDKIWSYGPGVLHQWTDRSMMTDKSPKPTPAPGAPEAGAPAAMPAPRAPANGARDAARTPARPKTRAGRPVADKDLLTITWTGQMEFTGRTKDPAGHPAARADFLGIVDASMTDAGLHCEEKMIVFTDKEVRLADLGNTMDGTAKAGAGDREAPELPEGDENAGRTAPKKSRVDIAMIYCYGKPTAISRKVDPDLPVVLEQQRIDGWLEKKRSKNERLIYNRRTGDFNVPGPGMVFLFNRPEEGQSKGGSGDPTGAGSEASETARGSRRQPNGRAIMPTSTRTANRAGTSPRAAAPAAPVVSRKIPPLVLMQVKFTTKMIGRVGMGQADDTRSERWSEFFGNIEFLRSEVPTEALDIQQKTRRQEILSPDQRLSEDGFYLTSQMMRIIQEPPPPGSPEKAPAHNYAKAWERVHVNKGEAFAIESDVATFDSGSDLLWAYGENGHGVSIAQQAGPGQPPSSSHARAVQYHVKTHAWREVDGSNVIWVDQRTGGRPTRNEAPDPTAPPKPKFKTPFKVPNTNLERRGFTGF